MTQGTYKEIKGNGRRNRGADIRKIIKGTLKKL
jgi:hypothetical protein